jgi:hypothetical protein
LPSVVTNVTNDVNSNTNTTINNQNRIFLSSSSPSLPANAIQVNADFNNDGFADLAIGVPGEDVDGISDAGAVNVIYGNIISGLDPLETHHQFWTQKIHNELQRDIAERGDGMGDEL